MEDGLWPLHDKKRFAIGSVVLILVLMEDGLWHDKSKYAISKKES